MRDPFCDATKQVDCIILNYKYIFKVRLELNPSNSIYPSSLSSHLICSPLRERKSGPSSSSSCQITLAISFISIIAISILGILGITQMDFQASPLSLKPTDPS